MSTLLLTPHQVNQKLQRIALEIKEKTFGHQHLILVGIAESGLKLANIIAQMLAANGNKIDVFSIKINKPNPLELPISCNISQDLLKNTTVILVDDVQNSGRTMIYAVQHFLKFPVYAIQTCVLVDRLHNLFPVSADYVGLSLSTTLKEHVTVDVQDADVRVTLS
jgi:pyrimidine operon attenuation protein/uracil phosphoribosyltransferase